MSKVNLSLWTRKEKLSSATSRNNWKRIGDYNRVDWWRQRLKPSGVVLTRTNCLRPLNNIKTIDLLKTWIYILYSSILLGLKHVLFLKYTKCNKGLSCFWHRSFSDTWLTKDEIVPSEKKSKSGGRLDINYHSFYYFFSIRKRKNRRNQKCFYGEVVLYCSWYV